MRLDVDTLTPSVFHQKQFLTNWASKQQSIISGKRNERIELCNKTATFSNYMPIFQTNIKPKQHSSIQFSNITLTDVTAFDI